jgi:hypothetical protein
LSSEKPSAATRWARSLAQTLRASWRSWAAAAGLLLIAVLLQRAAGLVPEFVDQYYSRGVYYYLGRSLAFINRPIPFSLGETLLVFLPIAGLPVTLLFALRQLRRGAGGLDIFLGGLRALLWLAGGGFLLFLLLWGLNYQRPPLGQNLKLSAREPEISELESISQRLIAATNRNYMEARGTRNWSAQSELPIERAELYRLLEEAYTRETLLAEAARGGFGPPKPVFFSQIMTRFGISGIYSPLTGEANYNAEQPACDLPYTIAHEMAHQRGFAREDEANFIAFLICSKASHPYLRYSGALRGLRVLSALRPQVTPERYREIVTLLGAGPLQDARASAEFWERSRNRTLSNVAEQTNNAYLQANRVRSGIRNYGEVTALIIGYYLTYPPSETETQ